MGHGANGEGGQRVGDLLRGPVGREKLILEVYDVVEYRLRKLPTDLEWRSVTVTRTPKGALDCRVTV